VSVCLCTYNGEKFLSDQLESINKQSYKPDQLIISDDGSTDATLDMVRSFSERVCFPVKIVLNDGIPLGVTKNFERALGYCTGDIIVFCDQDDIWRADRVVEVRKAFTVRPLLGYFFSNASIIDQNNVSQLDSLWDRVGFGGERLARFQNSDQIKTLLKGNNFVYGMSMAIRANMLSKILPIESRSKLMTHDVWIAIILSSLFNNGIADERCLVSYRQHTGQVAGPGTKKVGRLKAVLNSLTSEREFDVDLPQGLKQASLRVKSLSGQTREGEIASKLLYDKAIHLQQRAMASQMICFFRFSVVAKELFSGRYGKFSDSHLTSLRDLLG
jgi:glycosyltransferase involved in cell wall biosynthesis